MNASRSRILIFALLGYAVVSAARGADLMIGGVALRLGMPQAQVLAALGKDFDPKQVSLTEGKYILWRRGATASSAGSVSFKDGKLYRASKTWGKTPTLIGSTNATDGLYAVFADVVGSAGRAGRIKAQTHRAPGSAGISGTEVRLITFELPPDRMILVGTTLSLPGRGDEADYRITTVEEYLVDLAASQ